LRKFDDAIGALERAVAMLQRLSRASDDGKLLK
jgi:hypothetical protein